MIEEMIIFLGIALYIGATLLVLRKVQSKQESFSFYFSDAKVKSSAALWGFSASIFSTFALIGIPSFFASLGIMTYLFYSIGILAMGGVLVLVGGQLRDYLGKEFSRQSIVGVFLSEDRRFSAMTYLILVSILLIPYLIIQLRGISLLLSTLLPSTSLLFWTLALAAILGLYSIRKGIKAIYQTDILQGKIFMTVVLLISILLFIKFNGLALFETVNPSLLAISYNNPVLTWQFILINMFAFVLFPFCQPHMFTRIAGVRSDKDYRKMVFGFVLLGLVIGLCMFYIGSAGSLYNPDQNGVFLIDLLKNELGFFVLVTYIVALLAAAMSTLDSLLFSISTEWSLMVRKHRGLPVTGSISLARTSYAILLLVVVVLSQFDIQSIVLFSLNSIVGSSLLFPLVVSAFINNKRIRSFLSLLSVMSLVVFLIEKFSEVVTMPHLVLYIYAIYALMLVLGYVLRNSFWFDTKH